MEFRVELETKAKTELLALPRDVARELLPIFEDLRAEPRPSGARKLAGTDGFRIRRGLYRILYSVDDASGSVRVFKVSRRREVYSSVREQLNRIRTGGAQAASGQASS